MPTIINHRSEELHAGEMLGRYELLMPIAKGGMGNVWAARLKGTRGFRKLVAIKTVLRTLENAQLEQMLFQEAMLASQIHHPNVAETFELGEHEGTLYLVMELVSGESLRFLLREAQSHGGIPLGVGVSLVGQVCRGLAAAHDLRDENGQRVGLVHRDISPPNVLVTDTGTVKIIDFGVATTASSATYGSGEIKGKISYLAPEQLRGEQLDARVDVFATGILLYLLTVGRHPFRCASESATIARILSDAPAAPPSAIVEGYPDALEQVVMRALDKNRDTRFASITELLEALEVAVPDAFGPRADEGVAAYVQKLTKDRLEQRRSTLRVAEEWAETSSSRHSFTSLPAVAANPGPKPLRAAWVGAGGVLTGLAAAAIAATVYFRVPTPESHVAVASLAPTLANAEPQETKQPAPAVPAEASALPVQSSGARAPDVTPPSTENARRERKPSTADREERDREGEPEPAQNPDGSETAPDANRIDAEAGAPSPLASADTPQTPAPLAALVSPSTPQPQVPAPPSRPQAPTPLKPQALASKLGHQQLLSNPSAKAVRVPVALQHSGQTFTATLQVCVDTAGEVSKVRVLRSAGPALDPQIVELVSHWRYRPLRQAGQAAPFCYPMNYQVEPE